MMLKPIDIPGFGELESISFGSHIISKRHKMVARIHSQMAKNRDKLRFSPAELGKQAWSELADRAGRE